MTDLQAHAQRLRSVELTALAGRQADDAIVTAPYWAADLSRQRLDSEALAALQGLTDRVNLSESVAKLFAGGIVNPSEDRPAMHWALRASGVLSAEAERVRSSIQAGDEFADCVSAGRIVASSGKTFRNIVHIGIGGSDFGPRLLADAFEMERDRRFTLRFCANVDPLDLDLALDGLDPAETLVIGVSKSFGTEETIYNLTRAKDWLQDVLGSKTADHLALVTSRKDRAVSWLDGADVRTFGMPDSIGGRFSVWSNASIACRICLGSSIIQRFRSGAAEMDEHFRTTALRDNLPVRLALLDVWNRSFLGASMRVVLAYSRRLRMLPTYLQQLEMESNGKSVGPNGGAVSLQTAPAVWGGEGSVGQHSYHQWLHQGYEAVPTEFLLAPDKERDPEGRLALTAHALAQAEVLANGRSLKEIERDEPDLPADIARQKIHPGGRPSTFLSCGDFSPEAFGSLIALYEHRTYAAGLLWGINSFDQWGVERGKTAAGEIKPVLSGKGMASDPVTARLATRLYP